MPSHRLPCPELLSVLRPAYLPCCHFGDCAEAVWSPERGHVPRGYLGATARAENVRLVLVFAEPGDPQPSEVYSAANCGNKPDDMIKAVTETSYRCFRTGQDLFHRNVRWFLSSAFPGLSFDQQLQLTWLTEGRLCSFAAETGGRKDRRCAQHYLERQLDALPNAQVVAAGGKAQDYLRKMRRRFIPCYAFAPPGANHKPARPSWEAALSQLHLRTDGQ